MVFMGELGGYGSLVVLARIFFGGSGYLPKASSLAVDSENQSQRAPATIPCP